MCKVFFPSLAKLIYALSLCNEVSQTHFLALLLTSTLLINKAVASSAQRSTAVRSQYRQIEVSRIGEYNSRNISIALQCSGALGLSGSSSCRNASPSTTSCDIDLRVSNSPLDETRPSSTKSGSDSQWQTSLRSKPGTSDASSSYLSAGSSFYPASLSEPYTRPLQASNSLTTRLISAKYTVVIYDISTECQTAQKSASLRSWAVARSSNTSQLRHDSVNTMSSLEAPDTNLNLSLSATLGAQSDSIQSTSIIAPRTYQDTSTEGQSSFSALTRSSGAIRPAPLSSRVSSIKAIPNSSLISLFSRSPKIPSMSRFSTFSESNFTSARTKSSSRQFVNATSSTKPNLRPSKPTLLSNGSHSTTFRLPAPTKATIFSPILKSDSESSTIWLDGSSYRGQTSHFTSSFSSSRTVSSTFVTINMNNTILEGSRTRSMIPTSSASRSRNASSTAGIWQPLSHSSLISTTEFSLNKSISMTACKVPSEILPSTTSWTTGACKITTFLDPTNTLRCASSTINPMPLTACACPDGRFYERMAGGANPCIEYTSIGTSEFLEAMLTCTDLPTNCIPQSTSSSSPTATPPPIPYGGHFSAIPDYPTTCNATTITYSSTKPLGTGQINIDSSVGWGSANSQWKFRAGGGVQIDRMNNTSNPGTSSFSGNREPSSENFTKNADGSWTMTVVPDMPSLSLIAVTSGGEKNKSFPLTVTSVLPCDKPVALQCNNSFSDLSQSQWVAFEVDNFVTMIEKEFQTTKGPNFFEWFLNEYVGDTIKAPCQIDQEGCQPLSDPCTFVKPGPYQRQAFFVVNAMITLSRYIRYAWLAYERSRGDLLSELAAWTTAFIVPQKTQTWQNIVAITASVFGILSVIGFAAAPFMPVAAAVFTPLFVGAVSSGLFGVNSLLNTAINSANVNGAAVAAEIQFDGYAKADQAMDAYINASEQSLIDTNNAYFLHGTNLSQVLQGGLFVADTPIAELTDGDFSGAVTAAADWFDKTMIWSLINEAWKSDDNYIVFLPYGPIKWYSGDTRQFTAQMCHDQFLNNNHWNGTIYGSCDAGPPDHPGFACFMTAQKLENFNEYNKKSYYEVSYSYQNYKFDADDVFKSSIAGYYQHGYNYNATSIPIGQLLTEQNQQPIAGYINQTATSPGIFNIPICIISDTSYVPACTISNWGDRGDPCFTSPKQCLESKWIDPKDPAHVQNFTSFVSNSVVSGLEDATTYDNLWKI